MAAMVIEVPEELKALGGAMVQAMVAVTKARGGIAGGKSIDYAAVETAIGEAAARSSAPGTRPCSSPWTSIGRAS